jgi:hypothetical protein
MRRLTSILFFAASLVFTAAAQNNPESPLANAPPSPSANEQGRIIQDARRIALDYTANLPNFICTETIQRSTMEKIGKPWKLRDTLILDMAFSNNHERYKLLSISGKPTTKTLDKVGGIFSNADFGSVLEWIFRPKSETRFQWERWTNLRGRPAIVFSYNIEQSHSEFRTTVNKLERLAAFGGLVFIDRENSSVMRITYAPTDMPSYWPIAEASSELDYGLATIGEQRYFLPLHAELLLVEKDGRHHRNVMDFGNYRKFSAEATLSFEKQ